MSETDNRLINIYCITNKINGKRYIGQTVKPIKVRFYEHCRLNLVYSIIHKSIKKHGKENFDLVLLEVVNRVIACERETFYIEQFNTFSRLHGYNLTVPLPHAWNKGRMSKEHRLTCSNFMKNVVNKLPKTDKQKQASAIQARNIGLLPRTQKQLEASSKTGKVNIKAANLASCKRVRVFESENFSRTFNSYVEADIFYDLPIGTVSKRLKRCDGWHKKLDLYFQPLSN